MQIIRRPDQQFHFQAAAALLQKQSQPVRAASFLVAPLQRT
jgi:hypothetical protein